MSAEYRQCPKCEKSTLLYVSGSELGLCDCGYRTDSEFRDARTDEPLSGEEAILLLQEDKSAKVIMKVKPIPLFAHMSEELLKDCVTGPDEFFAMMRHPRPEKLFPNKAPVFTCWLCSTDDAFFKQEMHDDPDHCLSECVDCHQCELCHAYDDCLNEHTAAQKAFEVIELDRDYWRNLACDLGHELGAVRREKNWLLFEENKQLKERIEKLEEA